MEVVTPHSGSITARFHAQLSEGESSDRTFGFALGSVLLLVEVVRHFKHRNVQPWVVVLGGLLLLIAAIYPQILRGPKRAWLFFGFALGLVVNPIVLALLFFGVLTPIGWIMRLFGSDPMRLKRSSGTVATYWIPRTEPTSGMEDQF